MKYGIDVTGHRVWRRTVRTASHNRTAARPFLGYWISGALQIRYKMSESPALALCRLGLVSDRQPTCYHRGLVECDDYVADSAWLSITGATRSSLKVPRRRIFLPPQVLM